MLVYGFGATTPAVARASQLVLTPGRHVAVVVITVVVIAVCSRRGFRWDFVRQIFAGISLGLAKSIVGLTEMAVAPAVSLAGDYVVGAVKRRKVDAEPTESEATEAVEKEREREESSGRGPLIFLSAVIIVGAWRLVAVFPEVAYIVVGSIGTIDVQKVRAWQVARERGEEANVSEESTPDVGDGNGVLLTQLQLDLKLPNTKVGRALLEAEGIEWKSVRTPKGNGPGVHKTAIPSVPSPADDSHGDSCCCRSEANTNTPDPTPRGERSRVQHIRSARATYNPNDNISRHAKRTT
ncbi:hypothetical protein J8N05_19935 [Streptomyces sp. BH-SS-21]|uniref:Uncharacterized protein n=1 Tax=Streptomyces liliiviolaceus TaxID=2823109 RepID=A0A941BED5_9ACTN|nr:hypothetical protein [Streptomyces liliiviolaceus]MBQ0850454.1 hypothetical protein [Streptomyces liliiviolaceus]